MDGDLKNLPGGSDCVVEKPKWTQEAAIALCRAVEAIVPQFGCHVALTGGALYKDGERKDCDILFYRIRQAPEIKTDAMFEALATIGLVKTGGFGWCHKATYDGKYIDCFFPEEQGEYLPDGINLDNPEF